MVSIDAAQCSSSSMHTVEGCTISKHHRTTPIVLEVGIHKCIHRHGQSRCHCEARLAGCGVLLAEGDVEVQSAICMQFAEFSTCTSKKGARSQRRD